MWGLQDTKMMMAMHTGRAPLYRHRQGGMSPPQVVIEEVPAAHLPLSHIYSEELSKRDVVSRSGPWLAHRLREEGGDMDDERLQEHMAARKAEEAQMLIHTKRAASSKVSRLKDRRASRLGRDHIDFPAPAPEEVPHSFDISAADDYETRAQKAREAHRHMLQTQQERKSTYIEPRGKDINTDKISPFLQDRRIPGKRGWTMKGDIRLMHPTCHNIVTTPTSRGLLRSTTIA